MPASVGHAAEVIAAGPHLTCDDHGYVPFRRVPDHGLRIATLGTSILNNRIEDVAPLPVGSVRAAPRSPDPTAAPSPTGAAPST